MVYFKPAIIFHIKNFETSIGNIKIDNTEGKAEDGMFANDPSISSQINNTLSTVWYKFSSFRNLKRYCFYSLMASYLYRQLLAAAESQID